MNEAGTLMQGAAKREQGHEAGTAANGATLHQDKATRQAYEEAMKNDLAYAISMARGM